LSMDKDKTPEAGDGDSSGHRSKEAEAVLPAGWVDEFFEKADFEHSFARLEACCHFQGDVMRGRIRSLQLRLGEAREYFERALKGALSAPKNIPNTIRKLVLHAYWFENALLQAPLTERMTLPRFEMSDFSPEVLKEYPEIRFAVHYRRCAEGLLQLHLGEWESSSAIFRELIEANRDAVEGVLAGYHVGLGASQYNLGQMADAQRSMEIAGLFITLGGSTLSRASMAATLYGFYRCAGQDAEVAAWHSFLLGLPCPQATKDAFLKRAELLVERWQTGAKLVLFG
jgi:hypothetical protein